MGIFKNIRILLQGPASNLINEIATKWAEINPGAGMVYIVNASTAYTGTYIKFNDTLGSFTFTDIAGTAYILSYNNGVITELSGPAGKNFNVAVVTNQYISDQSIDIKKQSNVYIARIAILIVSDIPAWGAIHVAAITNWDGGFMLFPCIQIMGSGDAFSQACLIQINSDGNIYVISQGAVTNKGWFYGNGVS